VTGTTIHIPTLTTERLVLRAPQSSDYEAYLAFRASKRTRMIGGPFSRSEAFSQFCALTGHWHVRGYGRWIVADKETEAALGIVGLFYPEDWPEPEIAWSLFDHAEGRGIAFEAAVATRGYAFDVLGWQRVISCISPDNTRSVALARKMGAVEEGVFQHPQLGPLHLWRHKRPQ